jgi:hypothetical protein
MRLNTGERYKEYIGLKARRPKESLDVESELLTFCDVLHISLITKASDAWVSNVDSRETRPNRSRPPAQSCLKSDIQEIQESSYAGLEGKKGTDCVNFQVGEFGSPSTIFYNPCRRE